MQHASIAEHTLQDPKRNHTDTTTLIASGRLTDMSNGMTDMSTAPKFVCVWDVLAQGWNTRDPVPHNVSRNVDEIFLCVLRSDL